MAIGPSLRENVPCVVRPGREEEVDETGYLAANPDVAKAGQTAIAHFRAAGRDEGRLQWANLETVAQLRVPKLARVQWSRQPVTDFIDGEAANFLSAETIHQFGIPDDVPVSAHQYGPPIVELIQANPEKLFLDVGAGLRHTYYANVVNTDIYQAVSTDVICVGETLPFADEQFDFIFCFAVLEHTLRPWDVAREMCRVLKPGGKVFVDWPFLQPVHGYPHHYYNATPMGNRSLFAEWCDIASIEINQHHHPVIGAQWILTAWRNGLPAKVARKFEKITVGTLIAEQIEAQLGQDYCQELHPELEKAIASGSLLTAVKRAVRVAASKTEGPVTASNRAGPLAASSANSATAGLAAKIVELQEELDRMKHSNSWRITAPLRAFMRTLRSERAQA